MADPQEQKWYKMEVDGHWYKTQAASMDEARSIIGGQAGKGSNRPVPPVPRPDSPLNYAVPGSDLLGGLTGYFPTRTPHNGPRGQLPPVSGLDMAQGMLSGTMPQSESEAIPGAGKSVSAARNLATPGKRARGAAQAIEAVGDVAAPLMGPEVSNIAAAGGEAVGHAVKLGAGLAAGFGTQKGAEYTAKKLGASPDMQELASQAGFWIPTVFGMVWAGASGTPAPENPAVTPSGKTQLEAKAEVQRAPEPTPTPPPQPKPPAAPETQEQMNARIARNEARIAKGGTPTPEKPEKMSPIEQTLWQEGAFKEKPLEDTTDKVRKPELTRKETADIQVRKQAEALRNVPPEVRPGDEEYNRVKDKVDQLTRQIESPKRKAETQQIIDDAYQIKEKPAASMRPGQPSSEVLARIAQMSPADRRLLMKEFPEYANQIARAAEAPAGSQVGRVPSAPEAAKSEGQPVQATRPSQGPREPVRPTERPAIMPYTPEEVQTYLKEKAEADKRISQEKEDIARRQGEPAKKPKLETKVEARPDLGQRPARPVEAKPVAKPEEPTPAPRTPFSAEGDFKQRLERQKAMVEAEMAKPENKGVPKAEIQRRISERLNRERGTLGGSEPEDRQARREAKLKPWLDILRNPYKQGAEVTDAWNQLLKMGLSQNDIIQRMSGAEGFAKTPEEEIKTGPIREVERKGKKPTAEEHAFQVEFTQYLKDKLNKQYFDETPADQKAKFYQIFKDKISDIRNGFFGFGDIADQIPGHPLKLGSEFEKGQWEAFKSPIDEMLAKTEGLRPSEEAKAQSDTLNSIQKEMENLRKQIDAEKSKDPGVQELNKLASLEDKRSELESISKTGEERDISELKRMFDLKDERGFWRLWPTKKGAPKVKASPLSQIGDVVDRFATLGGLLEQSPEEMRARNITKAFASQLRLAHLRLEARLKDFLESHDTDGKAEFRAFMDAGEAKPGAQFLKPTDQFAASTLKDMLNERWQKIQTYLGKDPDAGIENYLGRLWKKRPGDVVGQYFGRSPIAGRGGFLKPRFYEYASDALDAGKEPITWNPVRMQLTALFQMDKWLAAHELKDTYKDANLVQWLGSSAKKPDGWQPLSDNIFNPKIMEGPGKLVEWGKYYAPPDVAKIFNRYVSPGLRGDPVYDKIRTYGNVLNQLNLGVSAYHFSFETLVSSAADVANGVEKVFNNHDIGGFKNMLRGTIGTFIASSARNDYKLGRAIQEEAIRPTGNPKLQAFVQGLVKIGATFDQDPMYETSLRKMRTELMTGHPIKALQAGVQNLSKPIMKYYVPRIKLGMAARMMETKMDYLIKEGITDPDIQANEMGKIWESVDNRAGQMVYDNLFWNKMAKDLSFLTIRAVGWDYGSAREFGGGLFKDPLQQVAKKLRGESAPISSRTAFVIGTTMTMGMLGGITHLLATGTAPKKLEDYFYPQGGGVGPDGKPERISYPGYHKDAYSFSHAPATTALHKLHPQIGQLTDLYQNKDFYNTEIRSEGDPLWKQGLQTLGYMAKSFEPFSVKMAEQRAKGGVPRFQAYSESFLGIQRAPSYVTQTKAEELALDYAKRNWKAGPLTTEERERRDNFNEYRSRMAMGQKLTAMELRQAFVAGKLRPSDLDRLYKDKALGYDTLQSDFKSLEIPEALKVYQAANVDERHKLKPLLAAKQNKLENMTPDNASFYFKQIQAALKE